MIRSEPFEHVLIQIMLSYVGGHSFLLSLLLLLKRVLIFERVALLQAF